MAEQQSQREYEKEADDASVILGYREGWGSEYPFSLSSANRRQHLYVVGKTGTGKTTLLRNLILQDLYAGRGVGVLDPHGDLAIDLLDHFPSWRADDLVYLDSADHDHPIGLNVLRAPSPQGQHLVSSGSRRRSIRFWACRTRPDARAGCPCCGRGASTGVGRATPCSLGCPPTPSPTKAI